MSYTFNLKFTAIGASLLCGALAHFGVAAQQLGSNFSQSIYSLAPSAPFALSSNSSSLPVAQKPTQSERREAPLEVKKDTQLAASDGSNEAFAEDEPKASKATLILGGLGLLALAGGGGGGGSSAASAPVAPPAPSVSPSTLAAAAPSAQESSARAIQGWLSSINTPYANQLGGGNGKNVVVGLIDTGVLNTHVELAGQIGLGYNALDGTSSITDQQGHGTHVAGIIAGTLANSAAMQGVAPGAQLAVAKVFGTGTTTSNYTAAGLDWAVNTAKASIVNLSLGSSTPAMSSSVMNAVNKGVLIVSAMGNSSAKSADWPAAYASANWANNQIIAVGSLDGANKISNFSNSDASLAKWVVFAPGESVASSYNASNTSYALASGTSMATPMVTGQATLIKSNWNFLSASTISDIIFQTATRLCSDGSSASTCAAKTTPDAVYGWGKINVGASLQPVGGLLIPVSQQAVTSVGATYFAAPSSGLAANLPYITTLAVDKYNRGYQVSIAPTVAKAATATVQAAPIPQAAPVPIKAGSLTFSLEGFSSAPSDTLAAALQTSPGGMSINRMSASFQDPSGSTLLFGMGGAAFRSFGVNGANFGASSDSTFAPISSYEEKFSVPYLSLLERGAHMGYGFKVGQDITIRAGGVFSSNATSQILAQTSTQNVQPGQVGPASNNLLAPRIPAATAAGAPSASRTLYLVDIQKQAADYTGVLSLGVLNESNSALGAEGTGALALKASPVTSFATASGSWSLTENTKTMAMLGIGVTSAYNNQAPSLISGVSSSLSTAWSIGIARKDLMRANDSFSLSLSSPFKAATGQMTVNTASQDSQTGAINFNQQKISLTPSATERVVELGYSAKLTQTDMLTVATIVRLNPGHDATAPAQRSVGLRYQRSFW